MSTKICRLIIINILLTIILSSFTYSQNQPKAWYVYKYATGLNNGTSWENAWTSFSAINWDNISPGDMIFISGGTDSIVYNETLNIIKPGLSNIYITKSNDLSHNGKVILDGEGTINYGILINSNNPSNFIKEIKITNLNVRNYSLSNILIRHNVKKIYLDSLVITGIRSYGININAWQTGGTDVTKIDSIIIQNCKVISDYQTENQTDLIYANFAQNLFLINNYLEQKNATGSGHNDCLQTVYPVGSINVSRNYFINYKLTDSQGAMLNSVLPNHTALFDNNVFYNVGNSACLYDYAGSNISGMIKIFNNTFYVLGTDVGYISYAARVGSDSAIIKNNIFVSKGYSAINFADGNPSRISKYDIDYNLYKTYLGNDDYTIAVDNQTMNLSNFKNLYNKDLHSIVSEPIFIQNLEYYLIIDSISPAIDNGTNLDDVYNVDIRGVNRPMNFGWDIGAYEFFNGQIIDNTPPQVINATLLDSVTLKITFSESLEQSNASNPSNYQIDNGIQVNTAEVIENSVVKITTSVHSPGFYIVTVNNVTDTAGNVISAQNNTANYGYNPDPLPGILKFTPTGTNASSIPEPDHLPEKTFDGLGYNSGDPTSRWAGNNLPQWIGYDLGYAIMLNKTRIQFYKWNEGRIYTYSIMVSTDSINWTTVKQNILSSNTEWTEENFEPVPARYIRIIVHSNNQNDWASLWETEFYGQLIVSDNKDNNLKPDNFSLEQNYPNPFNSCTKISWQSPLGGHQTLKVYDIIGNEVITLVDEYKEPGRYEIEFNASELASGIYIYRLQAAEHISTKKMILLR